MIWCREGKRGEGKRGEGKRGKGKRGEGNAVPAIITICRVIDKFCKV